MSRIHPIYPGGIGGAGADAIHVVRPPRFPFVPPPTGSAAFVGAGTLLMLGDGATPETFTTIDEVLSIGAMGHEKDLIDDTRMRDTAKKYTAGLIGTREMLVFCNWIPTNAQQLALLIAASSGAKLNFKYVMPSAVQTFLFSALVSMAGPETTLPKAAVPVGFNLAVTGSIAKN